MSGETEQTKPVWLEAMKNGTVIRLVIQPRASKTSVVGPHGEPPRLKIRVAAPPVDGEANEALLGFLKKKLGVPSSCLEILRGDSSKMKDVFCAGKTPLEIGEILLPSADRRESECSE